MVSTETETWYLQSLRRCVYRDGESIETALVYYNVGSLLETVDVLIDVSSCGNKC